MSKILTAAQMREVDARTIALGIPGLILMENAAHRVVEAMRAQFGPLAGHRIVIFCGKGNNGGDGLAIARMLHAVEHPASLDVVLASEPGELKGDASANFAMLRAVGVGPAGAITPSMRRATLVIDALLGTGASGAPRGRIAELITEINSGFPDARVVAVDQPSGIDADQPDGSGLHARADLTVTFTALKPAHALPPNCDRMGRLVVGSIGSPDHLLADAKLELSTPARFSHLFTPRPRASHKGSFGHVLVIGGANGKTGAAQMSGLAALRAGAGLVTVACDQTAATFPPELMTEPLLGNLERKSVVAIGPGLGLGYRQQVIDLFRDCLLPMVCDADALNSLAGTDFRGPGPARVLTPHPGEMSRLSPNSNLSRVDQARAFAQDRQVILVLKGQRTLIAFPDGHVSVNPTGSPAMATAGSGDILTGLAAGFLAQHPGEPEAAVLAAVYLHGRAGELGAAELGERSLIATDLLQFLPAAIRELSH